MSSAFSSGPTVRARELPSLLLSLRGADRRSLRAAWWALGAARGARAQLKQAPVEHVSLPTPPPLPDSAARGVAAVLRRRHERCLVSSLVWQQWHAAHGSDRDLVIGVKAPGENFGAHAWLDDGVTREGDGFVEIARHPVLR